MYNSLYCFSFSLISCGSDEIDDGLLAYIESLISKELLRVGGPAATEDIEDSLKGVGKDTIGILRMVKRRLEAERRVGGRQDVKLLSKLLAEPELENRELMLRRSFSKIEEIEEFAEFLASGIDHLLSTDAETKGRRVDEVVSDEENEEEVNDENLDSRKSNAAKGRKPSVAGGNNRGGGRNDGRGGVPVGTIERMRDILLSVERVSKTLETGLKDETDLYSTNAEDYLPTDTSKNADTGDNSGDNGAGTGTGAGRGSDASSLSSDDISRFLGMNVDENQ